MVRCLSKDPAVPQVLQAFQAGAFYNRNFVGVKQKRVKSALQNACYDLATRLRVAHPGNGVVNAGTNAVPIEPNGVSPV